MKKNEKQQGLGIFEKYLTLWVIICMALVILISTDSTGHTKSI